MNGNSPLLNSVAKLLLPPAILYSVYLLFRGHNLPGGGFIAGLMTANAVILQYVAGGRAATRRGAPTAAEVLIGVGLFIAIGTGLVSMALSYPFLTSAFTHVDIPVLGHFELASALAFDIGVYLTVAGVTLAILLAIEE